MPVDVEAIVREVERGLASESVAMRMSEARKSRDFYDFDGIQHMTEFLNDAETGPEFIQRKYRESGLVRMLTDVLCEHLYSPGPQRTWEGAAADAFLQRVYMDNHINALMQRAEVLATLMDAAAIQVDASGGSFDERPVRLRLWGADEFAIWEDPDDRLKPAAVVTVDKYDMRRRFRLWTDEEVSTFVTERAEGLTAGGRAARPEGPPEPNPYGMIPFSFVHYNLPINDFWEPGVGGFFAAAEARVNDRLSRLDQAIHKHLHPIPVAKDCPDNLQVQLGQPNMFLRLNRRAQAPGVDGAFGGSPPEPELLYLEAHVDVEGALRDLADYVDRVLEAARVPRSAVRMEQTGVASGIALITEQAPLLTRARRRQPAFGVYEERLARAIAACAGRYYRRPELIRQAESGRLGLAWPMPTVPVQTDDWLHLQLMRDEAGLTSKVQITMETYGCTREQAIAILKRVREDKEELAEIMPPPAVGPSSPAEDEGAEGEGEGEEDDVPPDEDDEGEEDAPPEPDDRPNGRAKAGAAS